MAMTPKYVEVAFPLPMEQTFEYLVPEELREKVKVGMRVVVPFRDKTMTGYVIGLKEKARLEDPERIKPILHLPDSFPLLSDHLLQLTSWVSYYYQCPWGQVLQCAHPPIKSFKRGALKERPIPYQPFEKHELTPEQAEALKAVMGSLDKERFEVFLLEGVTGSGKTEVYLQTIERVLSSGKGALILVPEIALTSQLAQRFEGRFPGKVALLHSGLPPGLRYRQWMKVREGSLPIVVGPRSAVFAPINPLGLVVVDEEQDASYKQEEVPRYNARDVAIMRAKMVEALVILGSATPSFESLLNSIKGKYQRLLMKERVTKRPLPTIHIVDLRDEEGDDTFSQEGSILSALLKKKMKEKLALGQQVMILRNRRGYAPLLICKRCGQAIGCPNCSVSLTYHSKKQRLLCHYCNLVMERPERCPLCQSMHLGLLGTGTERVEEALRSAFPKNSIVRMDSDTTTGRDSHAKILKAFEEQKVEILLGTQMIAKGLDFPRVTLVGVLNAEASLNLPDFRAGERTFQLLMQIAGRAGRGLWEGEVIIQTYNPSHFCLEALRRGEQMEFYQKELASRQELGYPPFRHMTRLLLSSSSQQKAQEAAARLAHLARGYEGEVQALGPAPAPLWRLRGKYRWHMALLSPRLSPLSHATRDLIQLYQKEPLSRAVRLSVDVDPLDML